MKWPQNIFDDLPVSLSSSGSRSQPGSVPFSLASQGRACAVGENRDGSKGKSPQSFPCRFWREKILHLVPAGLFHLTSSVIAHLWWSQSQHWVSQVVGGIWDTRLCGLVAQTPVRRELNHHPPRALCGAVLGLLPWQQGSVFTLGMQN